MILFSILQKMISNRSWRKVICVLSAITIFVTTYALILPAATLETDKATPEIGYYDESENSEKAIEQADVPDVSFDSDESVNDLTDGDSGNQDDSGSEAETFEAETVEIGDLSLEPVEELGTVLLAEPSDNAEDAENAQNKDDDINDVAEGNTTGNSPDALNSDIPQEGVSLSETADQTNENTAPDTNNDEILADELVQESKENEQLAEQDDSDSVNTVETPQEDVNDSVVGNTTIDNSQEAITEEITADAVEGETSELDSSENLPEETIEDSEEIIEENSEQQENYFTGALTYSGDGYTIEVNCTEEAKIPSDAYITVADAYSEDYLNTAKEKLTDADSKIASALFFTIAIQSGEQSVVLEKPLETTVQFSEAEEGTRYVYSIGDDPTESNTLNCTLTDSITVGSVVVAKNQYNNGELTETLDDATISIAYTEEAKIPDGAVLKVSTVDFDPKEVLETEDTVVTFSRFFDVSILKDEQVITPASEISVEISFENLPEGDTSYYTLLNGEITKTETFKAPGCLGIVVTKPRKTFSDGILTFAGEDYLIEVAYDKAAGIPDGTYLEVEELPADEYLDKAETVLAEGREISKGRFFDISLMYKGLFKTTTIEPKDEVRVAISLQQKESDAADSISMLHFTDDKIIVLENESEEIEKPEEILKKEDKTEDKAAGASIEESSKKEGRFAKGLKAVKNVFVPEKEEEISISEKIPEDDEVLQAYRESISDTASEVEEDTVWVKHTFVTNSFSVYGIVYTVDFHYGINGKTVEFNIPGGGFISLEHLVEVLNLAGGDDIDVDNDDQENTIYGEAIRLNEADVSEATKKFVAEIEKVEFSSPELVWIGKVETDTTVGNLKSANNLEVQYSDDLTEEQIAEINSQTVKAGDWALISMHPFASEETLTVTMKNGDRFVVVVTDASRLAVNYDSLNAAIDANNGSAKFLLYASKNSVNYYLKNDGTTTTDPPSENTLNNYTWTVSISNRDNHQYYFKGRNGLYLNLNSGGLTSTSSGAVILTQDGTQFKMTTSSRSMGWDGTNNKFYKRDDINPAKFNLYYVDTSNPSGGSTSTPGIVLTDEERQDLETWKNTLAQFNTLTDYDKTAEVVGNGDNRMYKVDLSASSGIMDFYKDVDLGFVLDVSNSMKFPSSLKAISSDQIMMTQNNLNSYYWAHQTDYNRNGCFYIISDPAVTSTIYKVFYDNNGTWKYVDASEPSTTTKIYTITDSTVIGKDGYRKPYTLYFADDTKDRFTYLKESVDYAVQTLHKIVKPTEGTDDETANVRIAYNFFCATITKSEAFKDLRDAANNNFTIPLAYDYTDSGTKQNEALYDGNHTISGLSANEFGWKTGSDQYVILVTDGAPNGPSMQDVRDAARNLKRQYPNVKIITIGLSTKDVEGGSQMLYDIADDVDGDGKREFYEAEKAKDLEYILLKILQSIMAKGFVKGTITDTIDEAFYPVDKDGNPLSAGVYNASGLINNASISDYVSNGKPTEAHKYEEFYTLEQIGEKWKITWYNQKVGWDDGLAETGNPWHGILYVKAKEDYLGGNLIETNESAAIEPTGLKLIIDHVEEPRWRDLEGMPQLGYPVPRVNVHNLETKENSTEWTVYKGTSVTPKDQIKALWEAIPIEEVVSSTENSAHKITTGSAANVGTAGDGETFTLGSLMSEVAPGFDIDILINQITAANPSASQEFTYTAYGHESGKITVKVERTVGNQTPAAHTADTVGTPAEQYKVTFTYKPYTEAERMNGKVKDSSDTNHHNGANGRGAEETGEIKSENTHTINVYARTIEVEKLKPAENNSAALLTEKTASFSLYRKWKTSDGNNKKVSLKGYTLGNTELEEPSSDDDYFCLIETQSTINGIAKFTAELSPENAPYYLAETEPPAGYQHDKVLKIITINAGPDIKTDLNGETTTAMPYNWTQGVSFSIDGTEAVYVDGSGAQIVPTTGENARTYVLPADGNGYFKTSVLNEPFASLQLKKQVTINDFDPESSAVTNKTVADGTYVISVAGKDGTATAGKSYTVRITITNGVAASATVKDNSLSGATDSPVTLTNGVLEIPNMIPGEYTVTEDADSKTVLSAINSTDATAVTDLDNRQITVKLSGNSGSVQLVTFTNNYADNHETDIAHVSVRKTFVGLKPGMELPKNFMVTAKVTATIDGEQQEINYSLTGESDTTHGVVWNQSVNSDGDIVWDWNIAIQGLTPDAHVEVKEINYTKPGYDVTTSVSPANAGGNGTSYTGTVSPSTTVQSIAEVITEQNSLVFPLEDKGTEQTIFIARIIPSQTAMVISKTKLNLSERAVLEEMLRHMPNAQDWYNGTTPMYYSMGDASNITVRNSSVVTYFEEDGHGYIRFSKKAQWNMVATRKLIYVEGRPADFNFTNSYTEKGTGIDIVKVDSKQRSTKLPGAVFTLTKLDESTKPGHIVYEKKEGSDQLEKQVISDPTNEEGKTGFTNLTSGYYEIKETKVPAGYVLQGNECIYVKVENGVALYLAVSDNPDTVITEWATISQTSPEDVIQVTVGRTDDPTTVETDETKNTLFNIGNEPGAALPNTGGPGTRMYTISGLLLLFGASLMYLLRMRRNAIS